MIEEPRSPQWHKALQDYSNAQALHLEVITEATSVLNQCMNNALQCSANIFSTLYSPELSYHICRDRATPAVALGSLPLHPSSTRAARFREQMAINPIEQREAVVNNKVATSQEMSGSLEELFWWLLSG